MVKSILISSGDNIHARILLDELKKNSISPFLIINEEGTSRAQKLEKFLVSFLENENILIELINKLNPTHIINTVALSSTIECKKNPEIAFEINTDFPIKLAKII